MYAGITELSTMESLMIALSGLAIVFLVLGCLALLIQVNAKVIGAIEANKKPEPAPAPKAAPAPVASPQEDEELVAVLVAAIAAETEMNPGDFTITSIKES